MAPRETPLRAQNPEVYYSDAAIVTADDGVIAEFKRIAAKTRGCAAGFAPILIPRHLHEMLIVHHRDAYVRPHKHFGKPKSFHVIEGTARVVIFENDGNIRDVLDMAPYGQGKLCYYRMPDEVFHSILITSEWLVFHETTARPVRSLPNRVSGLGAGWERCGSGERVSRRGSKPLQPNIKTTLRSEHRLS